MIKLIRTLGLATIVGTTALTTVACNNNIEETQKIKLSTDNFKTIIEARTFHFNLKIGTEKKDVKEILVTQVKQQLEDENIITPPEFYIGWTDMVSDEQLANGIKLWTSNSLKDINGKSIIKWYDNEAKENKLSEANAKYTITVK
ncbi:MAG: Vmc-like lipoprotein signal peptide domain-containing protein [Spiroplasma sp.]